MLRATRLLLFAFTVVMASIASAEKTPDPAPGPVPTQVITGKRAFVSYGESDADPGAPNLTYNEFYALMKGWGKYELTTGPADADLIFEIRYISGITDSASSPVDRRSENACCVVAFRPTCTRIGPGKGQAKEF